MIHKVIANILVLIASAGASFTVNMPEQRHAFSGGMEESRALDRAIENVVAEMLFIKRPFARSKLRARTAIAPFLLITRQGLTVTVRHGDRPPMIAKLDGSEARWTAPDGDVLSIRHELEGDVLVQRVVSGAATRTNRFEPQPDGRLVMTVEIVASALPRPLRYQLSYTPPLPKAH